MTVWDTVCLGLFRTFLFSTAENLNRYMRGSRAHPAPTLLSAWLWSHQFTDEHIALFCNPLYTLCNDDSDMLPKYLKLTRGLQRPVSWASVLTLHWHASHINLWTACFCRWLTPLHFPCGDSGIRHSMHTSFVAEMIALGRETDAYEANLKDQQEVRTANWDEVVRSP